MANTPKQILLYRALGAAVPRFAHLPMILGADGKKLSKRHGATAVGDYAAMGILPEALVNFLALLGWNPGDDRELMTRDEMVEAFTLERINKKSAVFDTEKLAWMNGQYLQKKEAAELLPLVGPLLVAEGFATEDEVSEAPAWLLSLLDLFKARARAVTEIPELARPLLAPRVEYDPDAVAKHWKDPAEASARLETVRALLAGLEPWEPQAVEAGLRAAAEQSGVGFGKLVHPFRLALVGSAFSPPIDQVVALMGRPRVLARIDAALARLAGGAGA